MFSCLPTATRHRPHGYITPLLMGVEALCLFISFGVGLGVLLLHSDVTLHEFSSWWQSAGRFQLGVYGAFSAATLYRLWWSGHYTEARPFWTETGELVRLLFMIALLNGVAVLLAKWPFSRWVWVGCWSAALFLLPLGRLALKSWLVKTGRLQRPTLIIGAGPLAASTYAALASEPLLGFQVQGFLALDGSPPSDELPEHIPIFPIPAAQLSAWYTEASRAHLVLALESDELTQHSALIASLSFLAPGLHIAPPIAGLPLAGMEPQHFFSHDVLLLRARNNLLNPRAMAVKRIFDLISALGMLVLLSPALIAIVLLIRHDGGPAIYGQTRVGRDGRLFTCYKFRSMRVDADAYLAQVLANDPAAQAEFEEFRKLRDDPRITPVGQFLRRTSLDELPQLWNVLKGEMSLIGPRPAMEEELPRFGDKLAFYLEARPGITGLWQVSGRNRLPFSQRVELDAWYVKNWNLWYDVAILFKTVRVVVTRDGAY